MTTDLSRRCTVVLLAALVLATLAGLLAYGPITLSDGVHALADQRAWLGLPNAADVLSHLPVAIAGAWGAWRIRQLTAPALLRRPWWCFFLATLVAGLLGAWHHVEPNDASFVLSQVARSAACALLLLVFLAERVDARWGDTAPVAGMFAAALFGGLWWAWTNWSDGQGDLRALLWLGLLPLLVALAGAWSLPGSRVGGHDWLIALLAFAVAHALQAVDAPVMRLTGVVSGHTLHHLALAGCIGWLAYRADVPVRTAAAGAAFDTPPVEPVEMSEEPSVHASAS